MSLEVLIQAARYVDHDAKCKNHGEGSVSKQISITGNNFDLESHKQDHTLPDSGKDYYVQCILGHRNN